MNGPAARLAVFISGRGSNLNALLNAAEQGDLPATIELVVASRPDAPGLAYATSRNIGTFIYNQTAPGAASQLLTALRQAHISHIALAGFLKLVPGEVVDNFPERIVNLHPALLPRYGGKGMYGHRVHRAVLASGDTESGVTVHLVDRKYDSGRIIAQERVPIVSGDTPESLAERIHDVEHRLYPAVIADWISSSRTVRT